MFGLLVLYYDSSSRGISELGQMKQSQKQLSPWANNEAIPMMKDDKKLKEWYQKTIEGSASSDEQALLARWLEQLDIGDEMDKRMLAEWKIRSMAGLRKTMKSPTPTSRKSRVRKLAWIASAAAVLLVAVTAILTRPYGDWPADKEQQAIVYSEYSTSAGQRKLLTLSDGSRVWLGNASKIRYPKDFQEDKREIVLEGQAFFEVTPDSARPFHVHAGELDIKVLGTSFDVKHYAGDEEQTVTVASGKVSVQPLHAGKQWILEKGRQVVYYPADKNGMVRAADLAVAISWKNGELVFRDDPLETIAVRLERWYGVKIAIASPTLNTKRLSLSVRDESLQRVLHMLAMAGGFRFEIDGSNVKIWK